MRALFALWLLLGLSASCHGQEVTEGGFRQLERARSLITENRIAEALPLLERLEARPGNPAERALALQMKGYALLQAGRHGEAIGAFEAALAAEALPAAAQAPVRLALGQLLYTEGRMPEAIRSLKAYLDEAPTAAAEAHLLLAAALAEQRRHAEALPHIEAALAAEPQPREAPLQLKLAIHHELGQHREAARTLLRLIALKPEAERYWQQLGAVLAQSGQEAEALAAMVLADRAGQLQRPAERLRLARFLMAQRLPHRAARLLEAGLADQSLEASAETLGLLADAWLLAREPAPAALALERAARLSGTAEAWLRLARVQLEAADWRGAASALEEARRRNPSKPGEVALLLGLAAYEAGDTERARAAFTEASAHAEQRRAARDWLAYLAQQAPDLRAAVGTGGGP